MSKTRKVLGAVLAVLLVFNVLAVSAFAAGATSYEEDASLYTQNWSLSTPTPVSGSQYKVNVILSTNYLVGPVSFKLEGVSSIDLVEVGTGYYAGSLTDKANDGRVFMVPDTTDTVPGVSCNSAIVAVVTYTTSAANGAVTIANDPKTESNPQGTLVAARLVGSEAVNTANFVLGQTAYVDGATVNPPAGEDVTLSGVGTGVVDEARGFVYGIPAATADITTLFEVSGSGVIEVEPNAQGNTNATGAVLKVYKDSSKAEVVGSYEVVVFGDVNGDGALTLEDAGKVGQVANYLGDPFTGAYLFAADATCDAAITLEDAGKIGQVANYLGDPITNPWA
ncbi:MAG: hypothetical protein IKC01_07740 [Clostridia bacterium]|nr:hypothetical protein [Clostridia bacterium]